MAGLDTVAFFISHLCVKNCIKERTGSTQRVVQHEHGANLNVEDVVKATMTTTTT